VWSEPQGNRHQLHKVIKHRGWEACVDVSNCIKVVTHSACHHGNNNAAPIHKCVLDLPRPLTLRVACIQALCNSPKCHLKTLSLSGCGTIPPHCFIHLNVFTHSLTHLDVSWTQVLDSDLLLTNQTSNSSPSPLSCLILAGTSITSHTLSSLLPHLPQLTHIDLSCTNASDETVVISRQSLPNLLQLNPTPVPSFLFPSCHPLQRLSLAQCANLSSESIPILCRAFPHITSLDLSWCTSVGDSCLILISTSLPLLSHLSLEWCESITDAGVGYLAQVSKHLVSLRLEGCYNLSDSSVIALANNCSLLEIVNLCGCDDVSDDGLTALVNLCPRLVYLNVRFCVRITKQWRARLKQHPRSANLKLVL